MHNGDGNENVKKAIGAISKQKLCTFITLFGTFLCRHHMTTPEIRFSHAVLLGGRRHWTTNFLSLSNLGCGPWGTGHYLSPRGWGRTLGGDDLIFRRTKGRVSRNWEPKRGDHWKLWKDSEGGPFKFAWIIKTWGGGRESLQKLLGGITSVK